MTPTGSGKNPAWGGVRPGAGRPRTCDEPTVRVEIRLPPDLRKKFKRLGGSAWLVRKLRAVREDDEPFDAAGETWKEPEGSEGN